MLQKLAGSLIEAFTLCILKIPTNFRSSLCIANRIELKTFKLKARSRHCPTRTSRDCSRRWTASGKDTIFKTCQVNSHCSCSIPCSMTWTKAGPTGFDLRSVFAWKSRKSNVFLKVAPVKLIYLRALIRSDVCKQNVYWIGSLDWLVPSYFFPNEQSPLFIQTKSIIFC